MIAKNCNLLAPPILTHSKLNKDFSQLAKSRKDVSDLIPPKINLRDRLRQDLNKDLPSP